MLVDASNHDQVLDDLLKAVTEAKGERVRAVFTYEGGEKVSRRLTMSQGGQLMVLYHKSHRRGARLQSDSLRGVYSIQLETQVPENVKWVKSWSAVLARLQRSGLWDDLAQDIADALQIGQDNIKKALDIQHRYSYYEKDLAVAEIKELSPLLIKVGDDGSECVNTNIIWYMYAPAKVKKMYFGKYQNDRTLAEIAEATKNRKRYSADAIAGYDISFEYTPDHNKAWYSEEYRGCGNGHYYLALDATHALFYEDD